MKTVSAADMRKLEERTIREAGVPGEILMDRAGRGAAEHLLEFAAGLADKHVQRVVFLAGKGNNGGDAHVAAKHVYENSDFEVVVYSVCEMEQLKGDAFVHAKRLPVEIPFKVKPRLEPGDLRRGDLVVDGLLGTGCKGKLKAPYDQFVAYVNAAKLPVVALDLPSGLDADSGEVASAAILADLTVTIGLPKTGLITGAGPERCGRLRLVDIGIPEQFHEALYSPAELIFDRDVEALLGRVPVESHKNSLGRVLVVGGSGLYPGAPFLSGKAALAAGAGRVTVAIPETAALFNPNCLALIARKIPDDGEGAFCKRSIEPLLALAADADALVVGPGMSTTKGCQVVLGELLRSGKPMLLDADALTLLAEKPRKLPDKPQVVITPHPGEAKRLLEGFGFSEHLNDDRITKAKVLAEITGAVVALKGHRTVVAAKNRVLAINSSGSPALATAGSGDVLSGILGAYLANGLNPYLATLLAVFLHGLAGEHGGSGVRGLTADELVTLIPWSAKQVSPFA